ncbi:hypothetical protein D3C79_737300 [compost metagenome]
MRLIGKTGLHGDLGDLPAAPQLSAGVLHALVEQVTMGRQAKLLLERPDQVGRRQPGSLADVLQAQWLGAMAANECRSRQQPLVSLGRRLFTSPQALAQSAEKHP